METLKVLVAQEQVRDLQRGAAAWRRAHEGRRWAASTRNYRKQASWS
jgi:hypothetical protein